MSDAQIFEECALITHVNLCIIVYAIALCLSVHHMPVLR